MRLSTLIELANEYKIQKNNKLSENKYKPINEAYYSSIFKKYNDQFQKIQYNNKLLMGDYTLMQDTHLNQINVNIYRNDLLYEILGEKFSEIIYDIIVDNKDDVNIVNKKLEEYVNNITFNKDFIDNYFMSYADLLETPVNSFDDIDNYMNKCINKYNTSFYSAYNFINEIPSVKLSDIKTSDLQLLSIKEARSSAHKNDILFWEDTSGKLIAVSYNHMIKMYLPNDNFSRNYHNTIYIFNPAHSKPLQSYISNISPSDVDYNMRWTIERTKQNIALFIYMNYCKSFTTYKILYDKAIKDLFNTFSTDILANDKKRQHTNIPEIGAVYAITSDMISKYDNSVERENRFSYKMFQAQAKDYLKELQIKRQEYVSLAKQSKEFIQLVDNIDNALEFFITFLYDITQYLKNNIESDKLKKSIGIYNFRSYGDTLESKINKLNESIQNIMNILFDTLETIGEIKTFSNVLNVKNNTSKVRTLLAKLQTYKNMYATYINSITNDGYIPDVITDIIDDEPETFNNLNSQSVDDFKNLFKSLKY